MFSNFRRASNACSEGTEPPIPATRIGMVEPRGFVPLFLDGEPIANRDGLGYEH